MRYTITVDTGDTLLDEWDTKNIWDTVAHFYPGYSSSGEIGYNDVLERISQGEYKEGDPEDSAWKTLNRDFEGDVQAAKIALLVSNEDIYDRTMSAFLSSIVSVERVKE